MTRRQQLIAVHTRAARLAGSVCPTGQIKKLVDRQLAAEKRQREAVSEAVTEVMNSPGLPNPHMPPNAGANS